MKQERQDLDGQKSGTDWTELLRDRLADYEEPVPADLWADIEARLAEPVAPVRRSRIVSLWGRWAVAASCAVLLLSGGYVIWRGESQSQEIAQIAGDKPENSAFQHRGDAEPACQDSPDSPDFPESPELPGSPGHQASPRRQAAPDIYDSPDFPESPESPELPANPPSPAFPESGSPVLPQLPSSEDVIRQLDEQIASVGHRGGHHQGTSIGLYAANGSGSQQRANGVLMSQQLLASYDYSRYQSRTRGNSPVYLFGYGEKQKYYQPVSLGLTVNIPISSRFSAVTGLVYTYLRSDFFYVIPNNPIEKQQRLHYLGVPLGAQCQLWNWGGLKLYVSGGAQADYNVKARLTADGVEQEMGRDKWQFSLQAGAGVQYNPLPLLGIYVEPGVKHYIDNGSSVRNFFKDKPTDFNLQVGLRLNLGEK